MLHQFILKRFKFVRRLLAENERLRRQDELYPRGHLLSPLPSPEEVADAFARGGFGPPFAGVDLNEAEQLALLEKFADYYTQQPFPEEPTSDRRFFLNNPSYGHYDAIMLYSMLRHLRPRRVIEVGSGFSSAAMLDLNEHVLGGRTQFTFIDPDMSRLRPLLRYGDTERVTLIEQRVQEVPLDLFRTLESNDVLFIDSSHVSKVGSDVNRLFFDVLPVLRAGVHIHVHDIASNFEYPRDWFAGGLAWNEQYLLRTFFMFNRAFRIVLYTAWLSDVRHEFLRTRMPFCARSGGGQLWLRRERSE